MMTAARLHLFGRSRAVQVMSPVPSQHGEVAPSHGPDRPDLAHAIMPPPPAGARRRDDRAATACSVHRKRTPARYNAERYLLPDLGHKRLAALTARDLRLYF